MKPRKAVIFGNFGDTKEETLHTMAELYVGNWVSKVVCAWGKRIEDYKLFFAQTIQQWNLLKLLLKMFEEKLATMYLCFTIDMCFVLNVMPQQTPGP